MKKHTLGLTIAALLLTACGGGSDDSNSPSDPNKPDNNGSTPIAPGKDSGTPSEPGNNNGKKADGSSQLIPPPVDQGDKATGQYQGKAFIVPLGQQPKGLADAKSIGSDKLGVLNINGKRLPLEFSNLRAGNMINLRDSTVDGISYKRFIVSGTNYQNQKFGYINDGTNDYIFSQGLPTANMPASRGTGSRRRYCRRQLQRQFWRKNAQRHHQQKCQRPD